MNIRNILYILIFSMAMAGCKKSWLDINTNPNQLPTSTPNFVFTSGVSRLAAYLDPNEVGSYWSGQWTQSNTYIIPNVQFSESQQVSKQNFRFDLCAVEYRLHVVEDRRQNRTHLGEP